MLAAVLCGSLSHDTVWTQSDIDLLLVTIDDRKVAEGERALYADGVNVHVFLMPRAQFRTLVEGTVRNSFMHALLAKGRLLYTHDQSIAELCARLGEIGARDTQIQLLAAATQRGGPHLQGAQVVPHPRRPRLHRPLHPLRRHAAGADGGDGRAADRRPRGDPAGAAS